VRCEALRVDHTLCMYPPLRIVSGKKRLCILHAEAFFRGEQMKWAPKRLLAWDLQRRLQVAVEYEALRHLNMEVKNV
jgi:hypothetical protein